jgi:hypothetical protein
MSLPGWTDWQTIPQPQIQQPPPAHAGDTSSLPLHPWAVAVGTNAIGCLHLFSIDAALGNLQHIQQLQPNDLSSWGTWQAAVTNYGWQNRNWDWNAPSSQLIPPINVARNVDGRLEIFCADSQGNLWHYWETDAATEFNPAPAWSDALGTGDGALTLVSNNAAANTFATMSVIAHSTTGFLEVFFLGTDGSMYTAYQDIPGDSQSLMSDNITNSGYTAVNGPSPMPEVLGGLSDAGDAQGPLSGVGSWLLATCNDQQDKVQMIGFGDNGAPVHTSEIAPFPTPGDPDDPNHLLQVSWYTPVPLENQPPFDQVGWFQGMAIGQTSDGNGDLFVVDCFGNLWCARQDWSDIINQSGDNWSYEGTVFSEYGWDIWQQMPSTDCSVSPFSVACCRTHVNPGVPVERGGSLEPNGYNLQFVFTIADNGTGVQFCVAQSTDEDQSSEEEIFRTQFLLGGPGAWPTAIVSTTMTGLAQVGAPPGQLPVVFVVAGGSISFCSVQPPLYASLNAMGLPAPSATI